MGEGAWQCRIQDFLGGITFGSNSKASLMIFFIFLKIGQKHKGGPRQFVSIFYKNLFLLKNPYIKEKINAAGEIFLKYLFLS
jgi:hypothetical protein